jgi:hypothetical protein
VARTEDFEALDEKVAKTLVREIVKVPIDQILTNGLPNDHCRREPPLVKIGTLRA